MVSDEIIHIITAELDDRDWIPLAIALGVSEEECRLIQRKFPGRARRQVHQMLLMWRQQQGQSANLNKLRQALSIIGLDDVVSSLKPGFR